MQLQGAQRKRLPSKIEGGAAKNISWSGSQMFDLAKVVSQAVTEGRFSSSFEDRLTMRRAFVALGHRVSISQFENAVRIFKSATSSSDVFEIMGRHRSYGDWWRALSPDERQHVVVERKRAQRAFVDSLTPAERIERRRAAYAALRDNIGSIPKNGVVDLATLWSDALQISSQLKFLEKGIAPGSTRSYSGVPEKMRSSWEALYAKVVSSLPNRFYIYEPMGFPLMGPDGRITAYHPDFFVYKSSSRGDLLCSAVEIKGELLAVGQRKIQLFKKLYFRGDFSDLSPEQRAMIEPLVDTAKKQAWKQFRFSFASKTRFAVYGYNTWDKQNDCFVQESSEVGKASHTGLIKRLQRRYRELVPPSEETRLPNQRRRELLQKIVVLPEHSRVVAPRGAAIARSQEVFVEAKSLTKLYFAYRLVQQSLTALEKRGIVQIAETKAELFAERALSPYFELIPVWHAANRAKQRDLLTQLSSIQPLPEATPAVILGGLFLKVVQQVLSEGAVFDFQDQPTAYLASREQLKENAAALERALLPTIEEASSILEERDQTEQYRELVVAMSREFTRKSEQFGRHNTGVDIDVPYVSNQFAELCAKGTISALLIKPTRSKQA